MAQEITLEQWARRLSRASGELHNHVAKALVRTALRGETEAKRRVTGGGSKSRLNVRTGRLRASIAGTVRVKSAGTIEVQVKAGGRSPAPDQQKRDTTSSAGVAAYAGIHEEGGTIKPKSAKMLAIPVHDSLFTGAGVLRDDRGPRKTPDLAFARSRKGAFLLVNQFTGDPWYVLKRSVKIRARPFLAPGIRTAANKMNADKARALEGLFSTRGL